MITRLVRLSMNVLMWSMPMSLPASVDAHDCCSTVTTVRTFRAPVSSVTTFRYTAPSYSYSTSNVTAFRDQYGRLHIVNEVPQVRETFAVINNNHYHSNAQVLQIEQIKRQQQLQIKNVQKIVIEQQRRRPILEFDIRLGRTRLRRN